MHRPSLSRLVSHLTLLNPALLYRPRREYLLHLEAAQLKWWRQLKPRRALSKLTSRMIKTNTYVPVVMKFLKFKKTNLSEELSLLHLLLLCSLTQKWEKPPRSMRIRITKLIILTERHILNQWEKMSRLLPYFQMALIQSMTGHQSSLRSK